jgi:hypothetical protein
MPWCGPGSSVGIATDYGLDGPGIESRWGRDFPPVQPGPGAHPASCKIVIGSFPGVKCGRGMLLTTRPPSSAEVMKSRVILLPTLWATTGPVTGLLYLSYIFLTLFWLWKCMCRKLCLLPGEISENILLYGVKMIDFLWNLVWMLKSFLGSLIACLSRSLGSERVPY